MCISDFESVHRRINTSDNSKHISNVYSLSMLQKTYLAQNIFRIKRPLARDAVRATGRPVVGSKPPLRQNGSAAAGAAREVVRFYAQCSATVTNEEKELEDMH